MSALRIGFIGPGRMGMPMVERLVEAGHDVVVHARRPETRSALGVRGWQVSGDLAETVRQRDLVLVCVFDDAQVRATLEPAFPALSAGTVVASHVTGPASTLEELARRRADVEVVDAPVSGTPEDIRAGRLTVLTGGTPAARACVGGAVRAYASAVIETGELGSALAMKLLNNLLLAANAQLVAGAAAAADSLGIAVPALLDALESMSGGSRASRFAAECSDLDEFATRIAPFLAKDVAVCRGLAEEAGIDVGLLLEVAERGPLSIT